MVMPLPMDQLRHLWRPGRPIGRGFTWAVAFRDGSVATEDAYGSLKLVPVRPDNPITAIAVVAVADPEDTTRHYRLHVPPGAEPVIFWRVSRAADGSGWVGTITVIGWRYPNGTATYLWVYDDGRVVVTDRDLYDL